MQCKICNVICENDQYVQFSYCSYECLRAEVKEEARLAKEKARLEPLDKKRERKRKEKINDRIEEYKHDMKLFKFKGNREWSDLVSIPKAEHKAYFELHRASYEKAFSFADKQIEMCKLSIGVLTSVRDGRQIPKQKYLDFMDDFEDFMDEYVTESTPLSALNNFYEHSFGKTEFYAYKDEILKYLQRI